MSAPEPGWESSRWEKSREQFGSLRALETQLADIRESMARYEVVKRALAEEKAERAQEKKRLEAVIGQLEERLENEQFRHADARQALANAHSDVREQAMRASEERKAGAKQMEELRRDLAQTRAWHAEAQALLVAKDEAMAKVNADLAGQRTNLARAQKELAAAQEAARRVPREVVRVEHVKVRTAPTAIAFDFERNGRGALQAAVAVVESAEGKALYRFVFGRDARGRIELAHASLKGET